MTDEPLDPAVDAEEQAAADAAARAAAAKRHHVRRRRTLLGVAGVVVLASGASATAVTISRRSTSGGDGADDAAAVPAVPAAAPAPRAQVPTTTIPPPTTVDPAAGRLDGTLRTLFPIGVDFQPVESFARWQALGINTLIRHPDGTDVNTWADAADAAGLHQIRAPREPASRDVGRPLLLAWSHRDEPDLVSHQIPPADVQRQYREWKAVDPQRLVLVNVGGDMFQHDATTNEGGDSWYARYFEGADLISGHRYPVNRRRPLTEIGEMVDRMQGVASPKPVFAYIETSDFDTTTGGGAPTADQLRGEVWHAIVHGARGIFYFPERVDPNFLFDATPPDVLAAMPALHAQITGLQDVLQGPIDPPEMSVEVDAPLEAAWRIAPSGTYVIALNMSAEPQTGQRVVVDGTGTAASAEVHGEGRTVAITDGTITDDFAPYEVHVYRL